MPLDGDRLRVLIVDDAPLFVDAIAPAMRRLGASELHRVHTGEDAIAIAKKAELDVALVDVGLPDRSGLSVGREILELRPSAKVVALTALKDKMAAQHAIELGFAAYVVKDVSLEEFEAVIEQVLRGGRVTSRIETTRPDRQRGRQLDPLTDRELEVLEQLVDGASGRAIAGRLGISHNTVRTHIQSILTKLQVHSRLEAAAYAVQNGLVGVTPPDRPERG